MNSNRRKLLTLHIIDRKLIIYLTDRISRVDYADKIVNKLCSPFNFEV